MASFRFRTQSYLRNRFERAVREGAAAAPGATDDLAKVGGTEVFLRFYRVLAFGLLAILLQMLLIIAF